MTTNTPSDFEQQVLLALWCPGGRAYGASVRDELEERIGRDFGAGARVRVNGVGRRAQAPLLTPRAAP